MFAEFRHLVVRNTPRQQTCKQRAGAVVTRSMRPLGRQAGLVSSDLSHKRRFGVKVFVGADRSPGCALSDID